MAERVSARLTASEGRRFGLTVGAAFLVLAAVVWWRGHETTSAIFAGVGTLLVLGGLAIPQHLGPVERAWMRLAHTISRVTTPILMAVIYFVVITPIGFMRRTLGRNPLRHAVIENGYWQSRPPAKRRSASMERQF
jgi:hypothetical protein